MEAGRDGERRAEIEIRASALFSSPSFWVLHKARTVVEHVFHIACLNFDPSDSSQPACRCSASHLPAKNEAKETKHDLKYTFYLKEMTTQHIF